MKVTVLNENTSRMRLPCEHGLSLYIEACGVNILFDMGQTDIFARNATSLGVDLSKADIAVLSHGHYDHGGGLEAFFALNSHAPVYMNGCAFEPHFNGEKYIGLDKSLKDNARIRFINQVTQIGEGLTLHPAGMIPDVFALPCSGLTAQKSGRLIPDDFAHEQYLLAEENGRRILISGCSHKGIVNIADYFRPDALVGGFHMSNITDEAALEDCAKHLDYYSTVYYTCHCTGTQQYRFMASIMKNLHYISTGEIIIL